MTTFNGVAAGNQIGAFCYMADKISNSIAVGANRVAKSNHMISLSTKSVAMSQYALALQNKKIAEAINAMSESLYDIELRRMISESYQRNANLIVEINSFLASCIKEGITLDAAILDSIDFSTLSIETLKADVSSFYDMIASGNITREEALKNIELIISKYPSFPMLDRLLNSIFKVDWHIFINVDYNRDETRYNEGAEYYGDTRVDFDDSKDCIDLTNIDAYNDKGIFDSNRWLEFTYDDVKRDENNNYLEGIPLLGYSIYGKKICIMGHNPINLIRNKINARLEDKDFITALIDSYSDYLQSIFIQYSNAYHYLQGQYSLGISERKDALKRQIILKPFDYSTEEIERIFGRKFTN